MSDAFTGERLVPGATPEVLFRQHHMRYAFTRGFVEGRVTVDASCGTGLGTEMMRRMNAVASLGIDVDRPTVEDAARRLPQCRFVAGNVERMPLRDAVADCIVSMETLEHVSDPEGFAAECARVLRPDGIWIVSTPNRPLYRWVDANPFHVREFDQAEFVHLVSRHFDHVDLYEQWQVFVPAFVVRRLLMRFLARVGVKEWLRAMVRPASSRINDRMAFDPGTEYPEATVRPHRPTPWSAPAFWIAVARREPRR